MRLYKANKHLALGAALTLVFSVPAQALTISINADAGLAANTAALAAFNRAADLWERIFTDPVTVNIAAGLVNLGSNTIIGQAGSVLLQASHNEVLGLLIADAADEIDDAIVAALPTVEQFSAYLPEGFGFGGDLVLTKANLKAIDNVNAALYDELFGAEDATINFNSLFSFDYDNSDGVGAGLIDFETVAAHEIGHALGFVSVVDYIDYLLSIGTTATVNPYLLDLFRFGPDANPSTLAEFTLFPRDFDPAFPHYFDDLSNEILLSTGSYTGDGNQASHWKDNNLTGLLIGMMDPTLSFGQTFPITLADIRALDVIGWDVVIPEPATLLLYGTGLLGLSGYRRRLRAQAAL